MNKLKKITSKVFGIDESKINNDTSPKNTPEWDSFNGLLLVSEIEKGYGIKLTMEEVSSIKDLGDIKNMLKKHGVKNGQ